MNDIDTAAIRAEWYAGMNIMDAKDCIRALCDALDAARMDTRDMDEYDARWFALRDELDAAERSVSRWVDIAERAEARAEAAESDLVKKSGLLRQAYSDLFAMAARAEASEARIAAPREILRDAYDRALKES